MPDTSLLRLSRSKAVRRALPRVVSPHACRFFSSLIKVAWFSFQPAYGANKHTHTEKGFTKDAKHCKSKRETALGHAAALWRHKHMQPRTQYQMTCITKRDQSLLRTAQAVCGLSRCFLQWGQVPYCYSIRLNLRMTRRLTEQKRECGSDRKKMDRIHWEIG